MTPAPRLVAVVALGGAFGAVVRYLLGEAFPGAPGSFPWTIFAINVCGSFLLASVPAVPAVRRSPIWTAAIGPGLLGGFTTLSTFSEQTRALLDAGSVALAVTYALGTLVACVAAVLVAGRASTAAARDDVEAEGGDE